jgi:hypothetical protein
MHAMVQTVQECNAPFVVPSPIWNFFLTALAGNKTQQAAFCMGPTQSCASHNLQVSRPATQLASAAVCKGPGILCCTLLSAHYQVCVACDQHCLYHYFSAPGQVHSGHACRHLQTHMHVNLCATVNKRRCRRGGTRLTQNGLELSNGLIFRNPGLQTQSPPNWI